LADEFLAPLNTGAWTAESIMTVPEFWEKRYLPFAREHDRESTVNGYRNMWARYLKDQLTMPLRDFRTVDCERVLARIALEYNVSITTLKHVKHLLSGLFRYALRTGVLHGVNPVQAACIPRARPAGETHAYNLEEIRRILEVLPHPAKAVIAVAAFTAIRKGELRTLRVEDYDGSSLKIRRSAWRKHINEPKGKRGIGTIPLIPSAARVLDEHLASAKPNNYIFGTLHGGPADLEGLVRDVIRPALKQAGLPWYGLHAFRRGLATNLHELGVADIVIQTILRHSDVGVTQKAYIKSDAADSRSMAAMNLLESVVVAQASMFPKGESEKDENPS
jgi:integrase